MFATFGFIAIFAILGAWARYGQSLLVQTVFGRGFPWATLSINVMGCFIMGFLFLKLSNVFLSVRNYVQVCLPEALALTPPSRPSPWRLWFFLKTAKH
jgi:Integral membrane protein possibly involved in chromosome condensation